MFSFFEGLRRLHADDHPTTTLQYNTHFRWLSNDHRIREGTRQATAEQTRPLGLHAVLLYR